MKYQRDFFNGGNIVVCRDIVVHEPYGDTYGNAVVYAVYGG